MHRLVRVGLLGFSMAALGLVAPPFRRAAEASIVTALALPDLVERADRIAVVEVMSIRSAWNEGHTRISSTIELRVVESWKGGPLARATSATGATDERLT